MVKIPDLFELLGATKPLSLRMRDAWGTPEAEAVYRELAADKSLTADDILNITETLAGSVQRQQFKTRPKAADLWFRLSQRAINDKRIADLIRDGG